MGSSGASTARQRKKNGRELDDQLAPVLPPLRPWVFLQGAHSEGHKTGGKSSCGWERGSGCPVGW